MKETKYKPEVNVREEDDGPGGTKKFRFQWRVPNPKYGEITPFSKKPNLTRLLDRQEVRCFVGWSSANQYAELKERHLAQVYADHEWPEIKTLQPC